MADNRVAYIDGLRAIAIIAVVGYHAGVPGFSGGFVGVDVFFVISGYLIINHIVAELAAGKFSFAQFYARRTIRLLPPLLVMIAVTLPVAAILLVSPYEWQWYGASAAAAALSVSNIYFLSKQGYFDIDAYEKPLLHTWSLSVEEQFYLVVPLLLMLCFVLAKRMKANPYKVLAAAGALVFIASLAGSIRYSGGERNYAFYLTHWRAWEFAAGGMLGFLGAAITARQKTTATLAGIAGIALVFLSIVLLRDGVAYPSYLAVIPVIGTALAIYAGRTHPDSLPARLLSPAPLVWIGLLSYSWYLWHWPLISFARIAQFGEAWLARDIAMAALALLFAWFSYRLVELPARRWRERSDLRRIGARVFATGVAACIALAALTGGAARYAYVKARENPLVATSSDDLVAQSACPQELCGASNGLRGALVGDSHSDRFLAVMTRETARYGIALVPRKTLAETKEDFAVVVFRWSTLRAAGLHHLDQLEKYLPALAADGRRVLIIGPVPEYPWKGVNCLMRAERFGYPMDRCAVPRAKVDAERQAAVARLLRATAGNPNVRYAEPVGLFCDARLCRPYTNGAALMADENHITVPYGADWLYYNFRNDFWWVMSRTDRGTTSTK
ncbi:MAG: acyltransferase [Xanthobacteraceae bacterium]|nr:acyltransferase [Xanthobacteraceae bacterium]QYK45564.1 MAG: acyltransferase [Xanthobacteraceae bacterium]